MIQGILVSVNHYGEVSNPISCATTKKDEVRICRRSILDFALACLAEYRNYLLNPQLLQKKERLVAWVVLKNWRNGLKNTPQINKIHIQDGKKHGQAAEKTGEGTLVFVSWGAATSDVILGGGISCWGASRASRASACETRAIVLRETGSGHRPIWPPEPFHFHFFTDCKINLALSIES